MPARSVARIVLPRPPRPREPHPFPVVAMLAPVAVSLGMWAVTRSPLALMFAAFGPVMALAGYLDAGLGGRRRHRRATRTFAEQRRDAADAIARAHEEERRSRRAEHPSASSIAVAGRTDVRWRMPADQAVLVAIGDGPGSSRVIVDGEDVPPDDEAGTADAGVKRLSDPVVADVPILLDAREGIGIVGPLVLARAVARGLVVQLVHATGPEALSLVALPDEGWDAFVGLPHAGAAGAVPGEHTTLSVEERGQSAAAVTVAADLRIVVASSVAELPSSCVEIVECLSPRRLTARRADSIDAVEVTADPISLPLTAAFTAAMAADAESLGLVATRREPPDRLRFDELPPSPPTTSSGLSVVLGATADGPFAVDLVGEGPHAVIGGTTGSGKSELLITWVVALAAAAGPGDLSLLLFDFKGGATFGEVAHLPHVVGLVTDLDEPTAARALASLSAELRQRERMLQEAGARDVRDLPPGRLARLVIVVDEFAAMIDSFPDLRSVFVDLAARGRSLGVHLVLCTQRPAVAVRDGVLANCDIRISLRVNNAGDSVAVVGTSEAASIPTDRPGRIVAAIGGRPPRLAQVATAATADISRVRRASPPASTRRPWLDPLPPFIDVESLVGELGDAAGGFVVGRFDRPEEQSQPTAVYRPHVDGHLLVLGSAGRGSSTLLEVLETQRTPECGVLRVPSDPEGAWDAIGELGERVRTGRRGSGAVLVLLDDLDLLCARWGEEYGRSARTELVEILRSGPSVGVHLAVTAHRATADVLAIADLFGSTVRLGSSSKHEHVLSGGESGSYRRDRRPGSGVWRGHELQLATVSRPREPSSVHRPDAVRLDRGLTMIVTRDPGRRAQWAREQGADDVRILGSATERGTLRIDELGAADRCVVVGDLDAWQQQWALLAALRTSATVVMEDVSSSEFRSLTRQAVLPPWVSPGSGHGWMLRGGARPVRVRIDGASGVERRRRRALPEPSAGVGG